MKFCWIGIHRVGKKWFWYRKRKTHHHDFLTYCTNCDKFINHGERI